MGTVGNGSRLDAMGNTRDTVSPDSINNGDPPLPAGNNYYYSRSTRGKTAPMGHRFTATKMLAK
jgi:hypothetical protein